MSELTFVPKRGLTTHSQSRLEALELPGKFGEVSSTGLAAPLSQTGVEPDMWGPHWRRPPWTTGPGEGVGVGVGPEAAHRKASREGRPIPRR